MSHPLRTEKLTTKQKLLVPITSEDTISTKIKTVNGEKTLSTVFYSTLYDIFQKFTYRNNEVMYYPEFKAFFEVIGRKITEDDFRQNILSNFVSKIVYDTTSFDRSISLKESGLLFEGL